MEMVLLALVGSLGLAGLISLFDSDDDTAEQGDAPEDVQEPEVDIPDEEVTDVDPEEEDGADFDLGATIIENEDGSVVVELGEDETGSLLAIRSASDDAFTNYETEYALGLYLVPEDVTITEDPVADGPTFSSPANFAAYYGLTELITYDLGTLVERDDLDSEENTIVEPPAITSQEPIAILSTYFENPQGGGGGLYFSSQFVDTFSPFERLLGTSAS